MQSTIMTSTPRVTNGIPAEHFDKLKDWLVKQLSPSANQHMGTSAGHVAWLTEQVHAMLSKNAVQLSGADLQELIDAVTDDDSAPTSQTCARPPSDGATRQSLWCRACDAPLPTSSQTACAQTR